MLRAALRVYGCAGAHRCEAATLRLARVPRKSLPGVRLNEHIAHPKGGVVFQHACKLGVEGIVSKRLGSRYRSGRSPDWLKSRTRRHRL